MDVYRKTWAEINLKAISHNFDKVKKMLKADVKILAAVKANAYGHGIIPVSRHFEKLGVDFLGTSSIDEAAALRGALIKKPILNLSNLLPDEIEAVLKFNIIPSLADFETAKKLNKKALRLNKKVPVHVKIDTGMGRIGVWHEKAKDFFSKLKALDNLIIDGLYTHFPSADEDKKFTLEQINKFNVIVNEVKLMGIMPKYIHTANSAALFNCHETHFNLVRPGLALYGVEPVHGKKLDLEPALSFKTRIVYLKEAAKGRSISYGRTFTVLHDTRIATLPVGYADGYPHLLSNKAKVLIKGKFYPVAGRVCMDQTMVDVGLRDELKVGDEVVLIGRQGEKKIEVGDIAELCATISYQILCWISSRVPRVYRPDQICIDKKGNSDIMRLRA